VTLELRPDRIDVWGVSLAPGRCDLERLRSTLSEDERSRAARFHFERDGRRFILSHGLLRVVLGRYLGLDPARLEFGLGPHGKPALAGKAGDSGLRFNLSHSGDLALYAVTRGREVGVDVERIRAGINWEALARRFFSAREMAALRALPPEDRVRGFFTCWTRKEAYLKARGEGLSLSLGGFSVSAAPGAEPALLEVEGEPEEPSRWRLVDLCPAEGYAATLAAEAGPWEVRRLTLPG